MNQYNPNIHHRRSIRLEGYDYAQAGLYFITICCQDRAHLFGEIVGAHPCGRPDTGANPDAGSIPETGHAAMKLSEAGKMIENEWLALKKRFPHIELHEHVVMPNHFHGILEIVGAMQMGNHKGCPNGCANSCADGGKTVGDMMDAFKSITTVEYIRGVKKMNWKPFNGKLWQRNYWEHIIRNQKSYHTISEYIKNNPAKWNDDKLNT